jgi:small subunit ribosomal protein S16
MGKKKAPSYRVVVVDGRSPRDGRYIEQIGRYDPQQHPSLVEIDNDKATAWISKGAQPTEAVEKLLNISGALNTMKVRTGQIHTVGAPSPAPAAEGTEPAADAPGAVEAETVAEEPALEEVAAEAASEEE